MNVSKEEKIKFINSRLDAAKEACEEIVNGGKDGDLHPWSVIQEVFSLLLEQDLALSIVANQAIVDGLTREEAAKEVSEVISTKTHDELIEMANEAMKDPDLKEHIMKQQYAEAPDNVVTFPNPKKTVH